MATSFPPGSKETAHTPEENRMGDPISRCVTAFHSLTLPLVAVASTVPSGLKATG